MHWQQQWPRLLRSGLSDQSFIWFIHSIHSSHSFIFPLRWSVLHWQQWSPLLRSRLYDQSVIWFIHLIHSSYSFIAFIHFFIKVELFALAAMTNFLTVQTIWSTIHFIHLIIHLSIHFFIKVEPFASAATTTAFTVQTIW